jgi:exonuclease III
MKKNKVDMAVICETWTKSSEREFDIKKEARRYDMYWYGHRRMHLHRHDHKGSGGLGILVRNDIEIIRFNRGKEGLCWIDVKKDGEAITVMALYVPSTTYSDQMNRRARTNKMMGQFQKEVLKKKKEKQRLVVAGDLNARIANAELMMNLQHERPTVVQRDNSDGKVNERGKQMLEICEITGLVMLNGLRAKAGWTWRNEQGLESVNDWICTTQEMLTHSSRVFEADEKDTTNMISSDHRPIY